MEIRFPPPRRPPQPRRRAGAAARLAAGAAAVLGLVACGGGEGRAEAEIRILVEEALRAVAAGDVERLSRLYLHDPRYEIDPRRRGAPEPEPRVRLSDFCTTLGFGYDPPALQVAVLRTRGVVTFDLHYRFRRGEEVVARQARVTLFVERRPQGWGILRDNLAFPSEPQPQPRG